MSRPLAYAQLVRLPNLPTALADVCLGALAAGALPSRWLPFILLLAASGCLYSGGMVWNDYFDLEQDKKERPFRPLPSERVTRAEAARLGALLLVGGVLFAALASWAQRFFDEGSRRLSFVLALLLVAAILLYNRWLKRTWAGPVGMGACRFLNVLLGVSVAGKLTGLPLAAEPPHQGAGLALHLALVVGAYVGGVTWFARTEARASSQAALRGAAVLILGSLGLALALPLHVAPGKSSLLFPYLLVALGFALGVPLYRAVESPGPANVQGAVKRCLMGLIVLDALLATALAGSVGLVILVLLAPSLYWNRKRYLYAT
jgi:4-hydroxybenzoate polyprenyltransferase